MARVNHDDLEGELFRYSDGRVLGIIGRYDDLCTHCHIVNSFKGKIQRLRDDEVSLRSLMVEKGH